MTEDLPAVIEFLNETKHFKMCDEYLHSGTHFLIIPMDMGEIHEMVISFRKRGTG